MMNAGLYPFWFWNGEMEESELLRQLRQFKQSGCDGAVIHCRDGNRIDYMSGRWLELVRFTCREARALKLKIWLYDEAGYPSGNANGMVQKLRPDLKMKYMSFAYAPVDPAHPAYAAFAPGSYREIDECRTPAGTEALRFTLCESERQVDPFSREACDLFLALTHERYREGVGAFFGDPIEAVYTDDESWIMAFLPGLAWSPELEREYETLYARTLRGDLPLLVEDLPGAEAARERYRRTAEALFLRNFIRPQRDWCHANGLLYTGHLCGDEGPLHTAINNFGSPFGYLRTEDIPAIDDFLCDLTSQRYLGTRIAGKPDRYMQYTEHRISPLMAYQYAAGVANQFKKGLFSAECLTFLGWDRLPGWWDLQMRFEIGMGVNLFTPHAFYYTVGGVAKRDCPGSYFFQQPGFDRFSSMFAAWKHAAELLQQGRHVADTLILYPRGMIRRSHGSDVIAEFQERVPPDGISIAALEEQLSCCTFELMRRHVGFDYGAEEFLADDASVETGRFRLGDCRYRSIVLISGVEWEPETRALLDAFRAAGGNVIPASRIAELTPDLAIRGEGCEELLLHTRSVGAERYYYCVNLSGRTLHPRIGLSGRFLLYDPVRRRALACDGGFPPGCELPPGSSCFLLPPSFACETEPLAESPFANTANARTDEPVLCSIHPRMANQILLPAGGDMDIFVPENCSLEAVFSEIPPAANPVMCNGVKPRPAPGSVRHPADPCFFRMELAETARQGVNRFSGLTEMLYVTGDFQVDPGMPPRLYRRPLALGDLARQGYPYYWGAVEYLFSFDGRARFVQADFSAHLEIRVNGRRVGSCFRRGEKIAIASCTVAGENRLELLCFNTPGNMLTGQPCPFGVERCRIIR